MTTTLKSYTKQVVKDLASLDYTALTEAHLDAIKFAWKYGVIPDEVKGAIIHDFGTEVKFLDESQTEGFNMCRDYLTCRKMSVEEQMEALFGLQSPAVTN
jgi:hypothetical protein